jgi:hypothetical protein
MKSNYIVGILFLLIAIFAVGNSVKAADLEVLSLDATPASPPINIASTLKIGVKYTGEYNLTDNAILNSIDYFFSSAEVVNSEFPTISADKPILPDGTFYVTYTVIFRNLGRTSLSFAINQDGAFSESNYGDNDTAIRSCNIADNES